MYWILNGSWDRDLVITRSCSCNYETRTSQFASATWAVILIPSSDLSASIFTCLKPRRLSAKAPPLPATILPITSFLSSECKMRFLILVSKWREKNVTLQMKGFRFITFFNPPAWRMAVMSCFDSRPRNSCCREIRGRTGRRRRLTVLLLAGCGRKPLCREKTKSGKRMGGWVVKSSAICLLSATHTVVPHSSQKRCAYGCQLCASYFF